MAAKVQGMMEEENNKEYAISGNEADWQKALSVRSSLLRNYKDHFTSCSRYPVDD